MAWECWHENYYKHVMLINPKFRIYDTHATVGFKIVSGLFMDDNYFQLAEDGNETINAVLADLYRKKKILTASGEVVMWDHNANRIEQDRRYQ